MRELAAFEVMRLRRFLADLFFETRDPSLLDRIERHDAVLRSMLRVPKGGAA